MICSEKIGKFCGLAVRYEKYIVYRNCNQCCVYCLDPCSYLCKKALEIKNKAIEGEKHAR